MDHINLKARAKINITLDVTGVRDDGYHELKMIMQTVELYDGVYIKKIEKPIIKLKTNLEWLPKDYFDTLNGRHSPAVSASKKSSI